jgi:integrase
MSSLRRMPYTKPIPPGAEIITRNGKRLARFKDKKGRTVTAPLTEDGQRIRLLSRKFYGTFKDKHGNEKTMPLFTDEVASGQKLAELERKAIMRQAGCGDPFEEHNKRPLADHLDDYRRYLEARGSCAEHVTKTNARILAALDGCRFLWLPDLAAPAVAEFLHELRRDPSRLELPVAQEWFTRSELLAAVGGNGVNVARLLRREKLEAKGKGKARRYHRSAVEALQDRLCRGIGIATSNGYLTAIKGFTRWLVKNSRLAADPLSFLSRLNAKTDVRHQRRALPEAELRQLLTAADGNPAEYDGMAGHDRSMLYAVAMATGFRAGELATLTPRSFALGDKLATIRCWAAYTKNRKEAVQPLPPDVAAALRGYLDGKPMDAPVWPGEWQEQAADMLRLDLDAAGIPYRDAAGCVADFHALRHSYITLLSQNGVSPKMAQELARHSDIRLTMNVYTHTALYDLAGAVDGLPRLMPGSGPQTLAATGTDGKSKSESLPPACARNEIPCVSMSLVDSPEAKTERKGCKAKPLKNQGFTSECDAVIPPERELPGLDSNQDKESQNLLCYRYTTGYRIDAFFTFTLQINTCVSATARHSWADVGGHRFRWAAICSAIVRRNCLPTSKLEANPVHENIIAASCRHGRPTAIFFGR